MGTPIIDLGANKIRLNNGVLEYTTDNGVTWTQVSRRTYRASLYRSANQTISSSPNTHQQVQLNQTDYDPDVMYDAVKYGLLVPVTGYYSVLGIIGWQASSSGTRGLYVKRTTFVDPTTHYLTRLIAEQNARNADPEYQMVSGVVKFEAGDWVTMWCWQNTGGDLALRSPMDALNYYFAPRLTLEQVG